MFRSVQTAVAESLQDALEAEGYPSDDLAIEEPPEDVEAVLASSVAFRLASVAEAPPPQIAEEIAEAVETESAHLGKAFALGPYVNFPPTDAYFLDTLEAAQDPEWGQLPDTGDSVVVEHTSANPTGPVHVGRARNPIVGDAVARILDFAGNDVTRHYYVNDAGRQIAVLTWAVETFEESELPEPERDRGDYDMVRYYRRGNEFLENAGEDAFEPAESEIQTILQGLEAGDEETFERVRRVVEQVLSGMRDSLSRLPAEFDEFVHETAFLENGDTERITERLRDLDESVYEEGAWQLDLPDIEKKLVFVRSDGTSLYATRDLAYHEWKLDTFDRAVTVLGEDHLLQAKQVRATLDLLGADTDRLETVHYSWVNLPEGGMSTREGTGIDLDDLLDEAIARARTEVEDRLDSRIRDDDLEERDIDRIARQVGVGAVRYDVVAKQATKSITFEWETALDFEAQSAPYIQYAHARACGILGEAGVGDLEALDGLRMASENDDAAQAERDLLAAIARFPGVIDSAAGDLAPHTVATFAREFADAFNTFYRECPVLDAAELRQQRRLALVVAAQHTLSNALGVLGIEAPDSM